MQNKEYYKRIVIFLFGFIIWGVLTACWGLVWYRYYGNIILRPFGYKGNWLVIAVYGFLLLCFSRIYGAYRIGYYKRTDLIFSNILAILFTNGITYLQTCLVGRAIMDIIPFAGMTLVHFVAVCIWSGIAGRLYQKLYPAHQMLVVYGGSGLTESLIQKMNTRSEKYDICEAVSVDEGLETVFEKIKQYSAVIICDVKSETRNKILKYCFDNSVRTYVTPKISDIIIQGSEEIHLFDSPLLLCKNTGLTFEQCVAKRLLDLLLSSTALILASPIMLGTALLVKLYDRGPVLYKQTRLTRDGKRFEVYKFRSMIVDAEKASGARLAAQNDNRVTPIGKVIRKTRLDELPQSLVGPRPERPEIAAQYEAEMPEFNYRLKVKAGLTGYAQVIGKYNPTPYDKLKLDLTYISKYSFLLDLKLIMMTIKTIFTPESTEGIAKGQKTAQKKSEKKQLVLVMKEGTESSSNQKDTKIEITQ